jgi:hypothetical protein
VFAKLLADMAMQNRAELSSKERLQYRRCSLFCTKLSIQSNLGRFQVRARIDPIIWYMQQTLEVFQGSFPHGILGSVAPSGD